MLFFSVSTPSLPSLQADQPSHSQQYFFSLIRLLHKNVFMGSVVKDCFCQCDQLE